ncbi:ethanolamine utilization protein EutH [Caproiciproducens sp.]|uniref:ethanolamine utilization protein EutH n=1 Tax=Caproiciproducens sp. TaxID=1954376 RepID=UPI0028A00BFC|nr:ethanolamine utilization protein EutH [Caproiciproducens sp.]
MSFNEIIMWVMAIGAIIGGLDRIFGNKLGLGEKFEEGFNSLGPLALGMVGIVCLAPVISKYLGPVIIPGLTAIGADPSIFGAILPNDTGGYPLAMELAINKQAGLFSGLIVASMLGCTIVFSIPVGLGLIERRDQPYFAKGLLIGLITVPIGSIIGGAIAGYEMNMVLINSIPVIVISVLLAVGLKFIPNGMIKGCIYFGKFIVLVCTVGLVAAAFQSMTGVVIIPGLAPIGEALSIVGGIGVVLLGTFPVLSILTKVLDKPLGLIGSKIGLDSVSTAGIVFTLANSIPVYKMMKDMKPRGKIINTAWLVPATAALGDHLGFTAGVHPETISAVVISKIVAGVLAVALAMLMTRSTDAEDRQSDDITKAEEAKACAS